MLGVAEDVLLDALSLSWRGVLEDQVGSACQHGKHKEEVE